MLTFTRPVYDQQAVSLLIKPKVVDNSDDGDGFFSSLGALFSDYLGASSFFLAFVLLSAIGIGYLVRSSRIDEPKVLISSSIDAELLED